MVKLICIYKNNVNVKKLKGHHDIFRLRVGDYRIIYTIDNGKLIITVIGAGSRGF